MISSGVIIGAVFRNSLGADAWFLKLLHSPPIPFLQSPRLSSQGYWASCFSFLISPPHLFHLTLFEPAMPKLLLSQVSSVEHIVKKLNDVTRKTVDPGAETLISQSPSLSLPPNVG